MKSFILSLVFISSASFAQSSFSCLDIYQKISQQKEDKREIDKEVHEGLNTLFLVGIFSGNAPLALGSAGVSLGLGIYSSTTAKETKVLNRTHSGSHEAIKFTKKVQTKSGILSTPEEVSSLVLEGIQSGKFCENFPILYNKREAMKYVVAKLKNKHQVTQRSPAIAIDDNLENKKIDQELIIEKNENVKTNEL
jgi:hypothetical protein